MYHELRKRGTSGRRSGDQRRGATFAALARYSGPHAMSECSNPPPCFGRRSLAERRPVQPTSRGVARVYPALCFSVLVAACFASPAWAAAGEAKGSEAILLGQILLLIVFGGILGELMLLIGQPAVMGQLLAGVILGPSVLGAVWPAAHHFVFPDAPSQKNMIEGVAQFGILLLLLLAGMETELALVRRVRRAAVSASIGGIV